jgi:hypothetical protein
MTKTFAIIAAAMALSAAPALAGPGYSLDKGGKCHDAHGKFAKATFCADGHHAYKQDKKGACHDEHGKFAKKELCH